MNERVRYRPFTGDKNLRIRLDAAPLELVLCQVKWPQLSTLQGDLQQVAGSFGKLLSEYPLYSTRSEPSFELSSGGSPQFLERVLHHWSRADRSATVTLSPTFITLSVKNYESYELFENQLRLILDAVQQIINLPLFDRVGIRYVNRISDPLKVEHIEDLVTPELLGHQALKPAGDDVSLVQAITQSLVQVGDGFLQARSGIIPPNETVDSAIEPLGTPSWVLDIDSFIQGEAVFSSEVVLKRAGKLADAAYDFFKLVIKDSFIDEFEGRRL